jgi:hypothetical protein
MLFLMTLEEALAIIGDGRQIVNETVIPKAFRQEPNSTYRNGYHWLFRYERDLARQLEPWLKPYRYELIGEKGILAEALSNAFYHGHRKDPKLPIDVRIYQGQKGMVVRIHDCGTGFNVKKIHDYFLRGKIYFHSAGNGFRRMADSKRFGVFYNTIGNTFHMVYLFDQNWPENIKIIIQ